MLLTANVMSQGTLQILFSKYMHDQVENHQNELNH